MVSANRTNVDRLRTGAAPPRCTGSGSRGRIDPATGSVWPRLPLSEAGTGSWSVRRNAAVSPPDSRAWQGGARGCPQTQQPPAFLALLACASPLQQVFPGVDADPAVRIGLRAHAGTLERVLQGDVKEAGAPNFGVQRVIVRSYLPGRAGLGQLCKVDAKALLKEVVAPGSARRHGVKVVAGVAEPVADLPVPVRVVADYRLGIRSGVGLRLAHRL